MICNKCGTNVHHDAVYCPKCGQAVKRSGGHTEKRLLEAVLPWEEKRLLGILGALGGAVVGGLILFQFMMFSSAYWVMTIGGAILAAATLGGYWRLAGRLSLVGNLVSIPLVLFTAWFVDWFHWVSWHSYSAGIDYPSFLDACAGFARFMYLDPTLSAAYLFGLLFMYEGCIIVIAVILVIHQRVAAV